MGVDMVLSGLTQEKQSYPKTKPSITCVRARGLCPQPATPFLRPRKFTHHPLTFLPKRSDKLDVNRNRQQHTPSCNPNPI